MGTTCRPWTLALLVILTAGCAEGADDFFTGRPSGMALAHNRVLDGSLASMAELLVIPARFPAATPVQRAQWQGSAAAWWAQPATRVRLLKAVQGLETRQRLALLAWLAPLPDLTGPVTADGVAELARALEEAPGLTAPAR